MAPKPTLSLDAIAQAVAATPGGMGIEALQDVFPQVPRRNLQRWLAKLVEDGRLIAEGNARARRYRSAVAPMVDPDIATTQPAIPLSLPGQEVRANVSRPLARRRPVGYRRAFLDDYQPNDSFLLPQDLRTPPPRLGPSPVGDRPAGTPARQVLARRRIAPSWGSRRRDATPP